jgi:hypothetical protein
MNKLESVIERRLNSLSYNNKILFIVLCCDRLYPSYEFFSKKYHFGDSKLILSYIDLLFESTYNNVDIDFDLIKSNIEQNCPDSENFQELYVSFAIDSCSIIYETLEYISFQKESSLLNILKILWDSFDLFSNELSNYENKLISELEFELKIIDFLEEKKISRALATSLRKFQKKHFLIDLTRIINKDN